MGGAVFPPFSLAWGLIMVGVMAVLVTSDLFQKDLRQKSVSLTPRQGGGHKTLPTKNISHNKGQKRYGPNRNKRYQDSKNTHKNYTIKVLMTQITMMVWSLT